jgi:Zn-finger nucleic acid-binding protein
MRLEENKDHLVCDFCKYLHFPEEDSDGIRVLDLDSFQKCPVCDKALTHAAVAHERVLYCAGCRGLLIGVDRFVDLIAALRAKQKTRDNVSLPLEPRDMERRIRCPRCHQDMDTHPYAGPGNIVIDNCPQCGLNWLDYPELRRIVTAPGAA